MGRIFLRHIGGTRLFSCASCDTPLTNRAELISTRFTGATGRAFLFNKVVNLNYSEVQDRVMLTGRHMVRDVSCKNCDAKLGWVYEFATEDNQRYKEGRVILERALVTESEGIEEHISHDGWKTMGNNCCLKNVYTKAVCMFWWQWLTYLGYVCKSRQEVCASLKTGNLILWSLFKLALANGGIMTVTLLYFGCMHVCVNIYMTVKSSIYVAMANYMKLYKCYTSIYVICEVLELFRFEKFRKEWKCKEWQLL